MENSNNSNHVQSNSVVIENKRPSKNSAVPEIEDDGSEEFEAHCRKQWMLVVLVLDRFFFVLFLMVIIISTAMMMTGQM